MKKLYYLYSFMLTMVIMLIAFYINGITPFGDVALLAADMGIQYIDFMQYIANGIDNNQFNILYSTNISMGYDFLPLFMYYLSSPITLITLTVYAWTDFLSMADYVSLLIILKISIASVGMYYYLSKHYHKDELSMVIFSSLYGLTGYNLIYSETIMWMDSVILLPILLALINEFIEGKSQFKIIFAVAFIMFSNFYSGYMVILFSGFYLLYQFALKNQKIKVKESLFLLLKYIGLVVVGILAIAVVLLPTAVSVFSNRIGASTYVFTDLGFDFNTIINTLSMFFMGYSNANMYNLYPLLFLGITAFVFTLSLIFNKKMTFFTKSVYVFSLVVMGSCLFIEFFYSVWHLFQAPAGYPFRFIFCFGFLFISIAYDVYHNMQKSYSFIILLIIPAIYFFTSNQLVYIFSDKVIVVNVLVFIFAVICLIQNYKKMVLLLIVVELFANTIITYHTSIPYYLDDSNLTEYDQKVEENLVKEQLYRTEKTFVRPKHQNIEFSNESMYFDYQSFTSYSSTYNRDITEMMRKLGYGTWTWANVYSNINPFIDSMFGVKYTMIDDSIKPIPSPYSKVNNLTSINENAVPIVFKSKKNIDFKLTESIFENQNALSNALIDKDILHEIEYEIIYDSSSDENSLNTSGIDYYLQLNSVNEEDLIFIEFKNANLNLYGTVYLNSKNIDYFDGSNNQMLSYLGKADKENEVRIERWSTVNAYDSFHLYSMDMEDLKLVKNVTSDDYTITENKIETYSQEDEYLYLSIANIDNMHVYLNGNKISPEVWLDELIKIKLDKGENTIEFKYSNPYLNIGGIVSILTIVSMIGFKMYMNKKGIKN